MGAGKSGYKPSGEKPIRTDGTGKGAPKKFGSRASTSGGGYGGVNDGRSSRGPRSTGIAPGVVTVFEDDELMVVDKPSGMITASDAEETRATLFDAVKQHVKVTLGGARSRSRQRDVAAASGEPANRRGQFFAGIVHRLDREASGLLVFSKTERALHWLKDDFKAKRVHRLYLALVEGEMGKANDQGTIQSFLKENRDGGVSSIKSDEFRGGGGKATGIGEESDQARPAVTHYKVLASAYGYSLLQVRLETGRKHQIRVHLAEKGHPIVGDLRYGSKKDPIRRLGLHAAELGFTHPATGQSTRFHSPAMEGFYKTVGLPVPVSRVVEAPKAAPGAGASRDTSWQGVARWYDEMIDEKRNDHYDKVIVPGALRLVQPAAGTRILDLACGQGVVSREMARLGASVLGIDAAAGLIDAAKARTSEMESRGELDRGLIEYRVCDALEIAGAGLKAASFDACACIMALSNINPMEPAIRGVADLLKPGGRMVIIITHPAFRAPDQTSWGWDEQSRSQFRRVDGYLSPGQKAIQMHPGSAPDVTTWTFHRPVQTYVRTLSEAGLLVDAMEEWPASRVSQPGPRAETENRARREIPLFLAIRAVKK